MQPEKSSSRPFILIALISIQLSISAASAQSSPVIPAAAVASTSTPAADNQEAVVLRPEQAPRTGRPTKQQAKASSVECEYEKGSWEECKSNGIQQRVLKLRATSAAANKSCDATRTVRRECKLGCKYVRGQWSDVCQNGLRIRIDTLISNNNKFECQPKRKVFKDCKRACHYVKSAWSNCIDGFKTRNLTLQMQPNGIIDNRINNDDSPGERQRPFAGANCVKEKQFKRECRAKDAQATKTVPPTLAHFGQSNNKSATIKAPKLTNSQKRKLKLQSLKQQTKSSNNNNNNSQSRENN